MLTYCPILRDCTLRGGKTANFNDVALLVLGLIGNRVQVLLSFRREQSAVDAEVYSGCLVNLLVIESGDQPIETRIGGADAGNRTVSRLLRSFSSATRDVGDRGQLVKLP